MTMNSSNLGVYRAITAVALELSKTGIGKDRSNQQQGYKFRGIDDVYNELAPLLAKNALCILPRIIHRDCVERVNQKGTTLFYVTVDAEFDFVSADDGSVHTVKTFGEAMDSGDKATNKAMSAAYKYAAFQAFCIPTEGDNDADATSHEVKPAAKKPEAKKEPVKPALSPDQEKYFPRIRAALQTIQGDDLHGKKQIVKSLTSFTGNDGTEVDGIEDYRKLDGKRLQILAHKLEEIVKKREAEQNA